MVFATGIIVFDVHEFATQAVVFFTFVAFFRTLLLPSAYLAGK